MRGYLRCNKAGMHCGTFPPQASNDRPPEGSLRISFSKRACVKKCAYKRQKASSRASYPSQFVLQKVEGGPPFDFFFGRNQRTGCSVGWGELLGPLLHILHWMGKNRGGLSQILRGGDRPAISTLTLEPFIDLAVGVPQRMVHRHPANRAPVPV